MQYQASVLLSVVHVKVEVGEMLVNGSQGLTGYCLKNGKQMVCFE